MVDDVEKIVAETCRFRLLLDGYCIEHAASKKIRDISTEILESGQEDSAEKNSVFSCLQRFISSTDFSKLRGDRPELDGRKKIWVDVRLADGSADFIIDVEP